MRRKTLHETTGTHGLCGLCDPLLSLPWHDRDASKHRHETRKRTRMQEHERNGNDHVHGQCHERENGHGDGVEIVVEQPLL
jgi:hypothetical protein